MKALRFDPASRSVRSDPAAPEPALKPGFAIVKLLRGAIGAADLAVSQGRHEFAGILGHRFVGTLEKFEEKTGSTLGTKLAGKRVVGGINFVCGTCELCRSGLSNHCRARAVLGLRDADGCLSDRFLVPLANLTEVPKAVHDDAAVFAVPLADALHAAQILRIEGKPYVTVLGDSCEALLVAQVMAKLNASVRLLGKEAAKFSLCEKWGVKHRHMDEVGRRQDQDVVVDCTGDLSGFALATALVRPRGKIVLKSAMGPIAGPAASPAGADLLPVVANELEIVGARCGRVSEGVEALARNTCDVLSLVTGRAKLADGADAFARASRPESITVLIEP